MAESLIKQALSSVPGGNLLGGIADGYHQDNLFIKYRDNATDALESSGFPKADWSADFGTFKLGHKDIPDRKFGQNYAPEFKRLFDFIQFYLNRKQSGLGDRFKVYNDEYAAKWPADERYKGNPAEAIKKAVANRMNISEIFNATDGLGISQAYVNPQGQIVVPTTQQGEGIMSQLNNLAATQLGKIGAQVLSTPAAAISGQQQFAAGGGVTITGGTTIGKPVTSNTTSKPGSEGSGSMILWVVLGVLFLLFTGQLKKLF